MGLVVHINSSESSHNHHHRPKQKVEKENQSFSLSLFPCPKSRSHGLVASAHFIQIQKLLSCVPRKKTTMEVTTALLVNNESTAAQAAATQVMAGKCGTVCGEVHKRARESVCCCSKRTCERSLLSVYISAYCGLMHSSGQLGFP